MPTDVFLVPSPGGLAQCPLPPPHCEADDSPGYSEVLAGSSERSRGYGCHGHTLSVPVPCSPTLRNSLGQKRPPQLSGGWGTTERPPTPVLEALARPAGLGFRSATVLEEQSVRRCTGFGVTESSTPSPPTPVLPWRRAEGARLSQRVVGCTESGTLPCLSELWLINARVPFWNIRSSKNSLSCLDLVP